jgi:hypothetical protein
VSLRRRGAGQQAQQSEVADIHFAGSAVPMASPVCGKWACWHWRSIRIEPALACTCSLAWLAAACSGVTSSICSRGSASVSGWLVGSCVHVHMMLLDDMAAPAGSAVARRLGTVVRPMQGRLLC